MEDPPLNMMLSKAALLFLLSAIQGHEMLLGIHRSDIYPTRNRTSNATSSAAQQFDQYPKLYESPEEKLPATIQSGLSSDISKSVQIPDQTIKTFLTSLIPMSRLKRSALEHDIGVPTLKVISSDQIADNTVSTSEVHLLDQALNTSSQMETSIPVKTVFGIDAKQWNQTLNISSLVESSESIPDNTVSGKDANQWNQTLNISSLVESSESIPDNTVSGKDAKQWNQTLNTSSLVDSSDSEDVNQWNQSLNTSSHVESSDSIPDKTVTGTYVIQWDQALNTSSEVVNQWNQACKLHTEIITFFCKVNVWYLGDKPEPFNLIDLNHDILRPLLCPCQEGSVSPLCPKAIMLLTRPFQHQFLCAN